MAYVWSQADVAALESVSSALVIPVQWLAGMLFLESAGTLDPSVHRPSTSYYGLNQINGTWLTDHGIDPANYLTWTAAQQLDKVVLPYLQSAAKNGPLSTPGRVELAQLAPALLADQSINPVVFAAPSVEFSGNSWMSSDGSQVTLSDLERVMRKNMAASAVQALALRASGITPPLPAGITLGRVAAVISATVAGIFFGTWAAEGFRR